MQRISHKKQKEIWEKEHRKPYVLLQMDSSDPSSGVVRFLDFLIRKGNIEGLTGVEVGCGKGRNVIWLAKLGIKMVGMDFSSSAIKEAKRRARQIGVANKARFIIHDATKTWPFQSNNFDIVIDCFATTDIETSKGRKITVSEMIRVVKPDGYVLVYVMSPDDEFHKEMIKTSPAKEKNAFLHPTTGKFEKTFDLQEILDLYADLAVIEKARIKKTATFFGKTYKCKHHWIVFQKK